MKDKAKKILNKYNTIGKNKISWADQFHADFGKSATEGVRAKKEAVSEMAEELGEMPSISYRIPKKPKKVKKNA